MKVSIGNTDHVQKFLGLKIVQVDEEMAAIVKWFNSFDSVYTFASCQGGKNERPWVAWFSTDPRDTTRLLSVLCSSERTQVSYNQLRHIVDYVTTWPDLHALKSRMVYYEANK